MKIKQALAIMLLSFAVGNSAGNIDFLIIKSGFYAGPMSCDGGHVIETETAFANFCNCISLDTQVLNYHPNFDSFEVIGIVYLQAATGVQPLGHSITTIVDNADTVWVNITYENSNFPDGYHRAHAYVYQIVAIPKQTNPISFKLIQSTSVFLEGHIKQQRPLESKGSSIFTYNILGRKFTSGTLCRLPGLKIISNGSKELQISILCIVLQE
jgi:hypothetical protein